MKAMKLFALVIGLVVLAACGGTEGAVEDAPEVEAPAEDAAEDSGEAVEETEAEEEAAAAPAPVTDAATLAGGTWFSGAREGAYLQFSEDGTWMGAFERERLPDAPDVQGVYRFEDGQLVIEDTGYSDLITGRCLEMVGTYTVEIRENGRLYFETVDDGCENRVRSLASVLGHARLED